MERASSASLKITLVYILVGALWILFSDELLAHLVHDLDTVKLISIYKGWLFVAATGLMLYLLVKRHMMLIIDSELTLLQRNKELACTGEEVRKLNAELEQRVSERTAELKEANDELESFSYSVSHDLRAPLRHIEGFAEVLLEDYGDRLDEEGQSHLRRLQKAGQRMSQLIDDLLELSRVSRADLNNRPTDLGALARSILAELARTQPERTVETQVAEGLVAHCDSSLLRVVLENLLGNAWKYSSRNDRARIEFGNRQENDETVYFVRDNGAGFEMKYADKLFTPFQRLHRADEFEGTGIGLATVKRIIGRHGGRIWVESAPERGTTFYFTLRGN